MVLKCTLNFKQYDNIVKYMKPQPSLLLGLSHVCKASGEGVCEAMVEYEYAADQEDELTLRPGDIITEVKKMKGGWWEGSLNGKRGLFPDNFVKEIKKETFKEENVRKPKIVVPPHDQPDPELNHSQGKLTEALKRPGNSAKKKRRARVTYSYTPVNDDELQLKVGDVVDVTSMVAEGWWQGTLEGKEGMFPSNFVEVVSDTEKDDDEGKDVFIKGKKVKGIGLGTNIFAGGVPKLKATKRTGSQDELSPPIPGVRPVTMTKEPPVAAFVPRPLSGPANEPKSVEKAKVLFPYSADNEDELSLEEGQIVVVLDKDLDDSGWWKGRVNGKEGVFPDNFVELLPPEETKPKRSAQVSLTKTRPPPPETNKVEPKDDKNKRETVVKRIGPPPPLSKKPGKNADPKLMAQTDDHKAQEQQTESAEPNPKLKHLTKERPKPPVNRQPASMKSPAQKDVQSRPTPLHSNSVPEPSTVTASSSSAGDSMSPRTPVSPPLVHKQQSGDHSRKTVAAVGSAEIGELRKQIEEVKENSVPKKQYDELKLQFNQLKSQVEHMKKTFDKRMYDAMMEIDEEKKQRIGLQVEVERVKKLVTPVEL